MKIIDLFHLSFENLKSRKSRIVFTTLGFSVAIGTILFLVSLGFGLQRNLLKKITTEESLLTLDIAPAESEVISLNQESLERVSKIPWVEKVSPQAIFPAQIDFQGIISETTLNLVDYDWFKLSGALPDLGRSFTKNDTQKAIVNSSVVSLFSLSEEEILGKKMKFTLFLQENEESDKIKVFNPNKEFEVIGVLKEQETSPQVYLKISDFKNLPIKEYQFAKVKVKASEQMKDVREKLISMGFLVSALSDTIDQANKIFRIIQIILGIFGIIALIVAAIGLANTMTITLLERTNEIGIMRAIGASPANIKWLFLGESTITGFLGGIGGVVIGIGMSQLFNVFINILAKTLGGSEINLFYYPFWFILFIILLSTLVGLISGFWPARRASKLNPLKALRYK